jgi:CubicO group peptidase (beta-lactamase class C family)
LKRKSRVPKALSSPRVLACLTLFAALAAACDAAPAADPLTPSPTPFLSAAQAAYWPTDGWRASAPEEQGMDGRIIARMLDRIRQQGLDLHSLLIIRYGYLVSETYFPPYDPTQKQPVWSCTKSVVSTLVGIAIDQGLIPGVQQRVADLFPGRTAANPELQKESMTLEDVLTMRTGLDWQEEGPVYEGLFGSGDLVQYMLDLPMAAPPGGEFNYCTGCSHLLSAAVQAASGVTTREFADRYLFQPLGVDGSSWDADPNGILFGGWGLSLTPRDMAKLGYLFLRQGVWDGNPIVSPDWVRNATRSHTAAGNNLDYGYQWWVYPSFRAYAALGAGGQTILVIPGLDLVVVTTAAVENNDRIYELIGEYIIPSVLAV